MITLPFVGEMRRKKAAKRAVKKKNKAEEPLIQKEAAPPINAFDPSTPPLDIQPSPSNKKKGTGPSALAKDIEARVPDKTLDVLEDVSITQDKYTTTRAVVNFCFSKDEKLLGGKSFSWLYNESALAIGQAVLLYNIFTNKAAHKYEQEPLKNEELGEELRKIKFERDDEKKKLNDAVEVLARLNEKVLNLGSRLRLAEEKVKNLKRAIEAKDKDIEEIKEQLLEIHDTSSFKARLEAQMEFKLGKLNTKAIDEEIKELKVLLSKDNSDVQVVNESESVYEEVTTAPVTRDSRVEASSSGKQLFEPPIVKSANDGNIQIAKGETS